MNLRRRIPLLLNFIKYASRKFPSLPKRLFRPPTTSVHALHCTSSLPCLLHPVHCGTAFTGAGYTSPSGCKIAERVRPRRGEWGRIIQCGMGMLHVQLMPRKITMGMRMSHCLLGRPYVILWHVSQRISTNSIYGDGAMRTAAAKVMPFACQNNFELKC